MDETKVQRTDCGKVHIAILHRIFGDEMTYNELKRFDKKHYHLKVWVNDRGGDQVSVRVWFDNCVVMDKKYSIPCYFCRGCLNCLDDSLPPPPNMFYYLRQLQSDINRDFPDEEFVWGDGEKYTYEYYNEDV